MFMYTISPLYNFVLVSANVCLTYTVLFNKLNFFMSILVSL